MLRQNIDPYESNCLSALQETVVQQRAAALQREAVRLARQRAFLREERRKARQEEAAIAEETASLTHVERPDWWPADHLASSGSPGDRLRVRVGGQDFEVSKSTLCQDPQSLLFALCQDDSPARVPGSEAGLSDTVVVDRDWWLFRFIVTFLRDGLIPSDRGIALQLYREAAFWRLSSLQRAIEEAHLNLRRRDIGLDDDGAVVEKEADEKSQFWKHKTNWWEAQKSKEEKADEEKKEKEEEKKKDWWLDPPAQPDEEPSFVRTTWGYRGGRASSWN